MKRNTILKKIDFHEEKIEKALNDFQDFLYSIEDEEILIMGDDFREKALEFIHENDTVNINDIREFVENDYESEQ